MEGSGVNTEQSVRLERLAHMPLEPNPVLLEHAEKRAKNVQNRIADAITAFSGSMLFVYIHIIWFACWVGFGVEHYPYGLLTMILSLEAIFLSTFVLISQNRTDAKASGDRRSAMADRQGGGSAKRRADPHLEPDPQPDEGDPRVRASDAISRQLDEEDLT
jgi:uncharacterized membrane protein